MSSSINDPDVRARLQSLVNRRTPDAPPFGSLFSRIVAAIKTPVNVMAAMRPALKAPSVVARAEMKAHLLNLARPGAMKARPARPAGRRPARQPNRPAAPPSSRPAAPPAPMSSPAQAANMPVTEPPGPEIDVTPQPTYDGFHGFAPGFNEAGNDFGDLEADLGLD
jgi:hypothetical protein